MHLHVLPARLLGKSLPRHNQNFMDYVLSSLHSIPREIECLGQKHATIERTQPLNEAGLKGLYQKLILCQCTQLAFIVAADREISEYNKDLSHIRAYKAIEARNSEHGMGGHYYYLEYNTQSGLGIKRYSLGVFILIIKPEMDCHAQVSDETYFQQQRKTNADATHFAHMRH